MIHNNSYRNLSILKLIRIIVCFLLCYYLSACSKETEPVIRFGLSAGAVTLDPRFATDAVSHRINRLIYQRLVDFDDHYQMQPMLADWQNLAPDLYRFRLGNNNRSFHNNSYLTATDVKATYDTILDPATVSPHRITLSNIRRIEVIDEDTIDFYLENPDPLFPGRLVIGILPQGLLEQDYPFGYQPVGSGPIQFIEWPDDDTIRLQRRADGQMIEFITVRDSTVRILKLLRGEIDIIQGDIPFEMINWLKGKQEIEIETGRGNIFTYLGFNMQDENLAKLDTRLAIAHALDREAIIEYVLGGAAKKAGAILSPDHWAGHPLLDGHSYDPGLSRKLLKKAGYSQTRPLHLTYKTSNNPLRLRLATIIQYQLKQVGIEVEIQSFDWGTFYGDIKSGKFQIYSLSWVGLNMPDVFRYVFHSKSIPPAGANRGRYDNENVDMMIETAESYNDLENQAIMFRQLQEYLHEELPYVPLWYEDNILTHRMTITGYELTPDGDYDGLVITRKQIQ